MTKAELIEEVSRVVEMTRKDSEVIGDAIVDSVVRSLRGGDKIEIRGFGSFRTRQRQPRVGRNPKTGTRVEVPAKRIPYFKPHKLLKNISIYREIFLDGTSGKIGYGSCYGEQSYNGRPLYPGSLIHSGWEIPSLPAPADESATFPFATQYDEYATGFQNR